MDTTSSTSPLFSPSPINFKTKTESFNHTHEFIINKEKILYRIKTALDRSWRYLDFLQHKIPVQLSADGAELVVVDGEHGIHYLKIITECRDLTDAAGKFGAYKWKDNLAQTAKWKTARFTLPLTNSLSHLWAISHRGQLVSYYQDIAEKKHIDTIGVTTLYQLAKDGKSIYYGDPSLPGGIGYTLPFPKDPHFIVTAISASGSTLFLVGYTHVNRERKIAMYTGEFDFDILGENPQKKYCLNPQNTDSGTIILSQHWTVQPKIPLSGKAEMLNAITIFQTGLGNGARTMCVLGKDTGGNFGIYTKQIAESAWQFRADEKDPTDLDRSHPISFVLN